MLSNDINHCMIARKYTICENPENEKDIISQMFFIFPFCVPKISSIYIEYKARCVSTKILSKNITF